MRTSLLLSALATLAVAAGCSSQRQAQLAGTDDLYGGSRAVRTTVTTTTTTTTEYVTPSSGNTATAAAPTTSQPSYYSQAPAQQQGQQDYYQAPNSTTTTQDPNGTTYVTNNYYGTGSALAYSSPLGYYRPWYRPGFSIGLGYSSWSGFSPYVSYGLASPYYYDPFWATPSLYNPYFGYSYYRPFGYDPFWGAAYNPYFYSPFAYNPYCNPYFGYTYGFGYNMGYYPYSPYGYGGYYGYNNGYYNGNSGSDRPGAVVPTVVHAPAQRSGSNYGRPVAPTYSNGGPNTVISRYPQGNGTPGRGGRTGVEEGSSALGNRTANTNRPAPVQTPDQQGFRESGNRFQNSPTPTPNPNPVTPQPANANVGRQDYYSRPAQPAQAPTMPAQQQAMQPTPTQRGNASLGSSPSGQQESYTRPAATPAPAPAPQRNYYAPPAQQSNYGGQQSYGQQAPARVESAPRYNTPAPSRSYDFGGNSGRSFGGGNSGGGGGGGGGSRSGGGGSRGPR